MTQQTLPLKKMLYKAVVGYRYTVPSVAPFILLLVIIKDSYRFVGGMPEHPVVHMAIMIVMALVFIYLWSVILCVSHHALHRKKMSLNQACIWVGKKILWIYATALFALVLFMLIAFVGQLISKFLAHFTSAKFLQLVWVYIFYSLPLLIYMMLSWLALPVVMWEKSQPWQALWQSAKIINWRHLKPTFLLLVVTMILLFLTLPTTRHGAWLARHYLLLIFDFIVFICILPFIANLTILLYDRLSIIYAKSH